VGRAGILNSRFRGVNGYNSSTAARISGHLHLFKYGWFLLAAFAFSRFIDSPRVRRGVILGLTSALVIQSSFYFGYFLVLSFGIMGVGLLIAGSLGRRHLVGGFACGVVLIVLTAAFTFPVWTITRHSDSFRDYLSRYPRHVWYFGSEPVSMFWPPWRQPSWRSPMRFIHEERPWCTEGWNYPGMAVWLVLGGYLLLWLRTGSRLALPVEVDRFLVLSMILAILSLSGGPGILLYEWFPSFRCYGRAGILALSLWAVIVPVLMQRIGRRFLRPLARALVFVGLMSLAVVEGIWAGEPLYHHQQAPVPAWVSWLASQPSDVRLVAFQRFKDPLLSVRVLTDADIWSWTFYAMLHRHDTLNGADVDQVEEDLRPLGASLLEDDLNESALRLFVSQGYNHFAFTKDYLKAQPTLEHLPWLEHICTLRVGSFSERGPRS
jgi:hypothetical protein